MSMNRRYYVIAGYDLTGYETDKYKDWKWTKEGEWFTCNQKTKGYIQLFDDFHLYLGYILAYGDEYDFETTKVTLAEIERQQPYVNHKLQELINIGVVSNDIIDSNLKYEVIIFEECI